jgi:hypothetical protein
MQMKYRTQRHPSCMKLEATSITYGHRSQRIPVPVRSLIDKLRIGGLVVRLVTTGESPLLYVFVSLSFFGELKPSRRGRNRPKWAITADSQKNSRCR